MGPETLVYNRMMLETRLRMGFFGLHARELQEDAGGL